MGLVRTAVNRLGYLRLTAAIRPYEAAQGLVEYALAVVLLALVAAGALKILGTDIQKVIQDISTFLQH